jgi:hypothetical protein
MFVWCVRVLHFAEGVAYKRIQAARAARSHPKLLEALRCGDLHLTAVSLLAPKLTKDNCEVLISAASHRTADEIKRLLADREPKPTAPALVRRLPESPKVKAPAVIPSVTPRLAVPPPPPVTQSELAPRAQTEPLGIERYRVQFTANKETSAQLDELRALMRHQIPDGDVGRILSKAIAVLLDQVRRRKFAQTSSARSMKSGKHPSRHIPAATRREVWQRDGGHCTFVSRDGRRCASKEFLEFDHVDAWARSRSHSADGITLRCRAHSQWRARQDFGEAQMARFVPRTGTGFESSSP